MASIHEARNASGFALISDPRSRWINFGLRFLIAAALLIGIFTVVELMAQPYIGYRFDPETGRVRSVTPDGPGYRAGVRPGDVLVEIEGVPLHAALPLYPNKAAGDSVDYMLLRDGRSYSTEVVLEAPPRQVWSNYLSYLALGAALWLLGAIAFIQRPWDETTQIFLALSIYAAISIWVLPLTAYLVDWARRLMFAAVLMTGASFLHFHTIFPQRVTHPRWRNILMLSYASAVFLASFSLVIGPAQMVEWAHLAGFSWYLPGNIVRIHFVLTAGTGVLLLLAAYRQKSGKARRRVRLIVVGTVLPMVAMLMLFVSEIFGNNLRPYHLVVTALITIPTVYTISISRLDLMGVDTFLHRAVVYLVGALLVAAIYLSLFSLINTVLEVPAERVPLTGALTSIVVALLFSPLQQGAQRAINRLFYGPGYNYLEVLETSMRQVSVQLDEAMLIQIMTSDLTDAMRVEYAGLWMTNGQGEFEWAGGRLTPMERGYHLALEEMPGGLLRGRFIAQRLDEKPLLPVVSPVRWWVPLCLADELQGVWAIGPRLGDASFSPIDYQLMQTAANQASLVIKVVRLVEQLRGQLKQSEQDRLELRSAFAQLVNAREAERTHIARELHDSILQQLHTFGIFFRSARQKAEGRLAQDLEQLHDQSRQIALDTRRLCQGLRPAALGQSTIADALETLVENEFNPLPFKLSVTVTPKNSHLPEDVKVAVFRIVQEGLRNVEKHASAHSVKVTIDVTDRTISLVVQDDGCGFERIQVTRRNLGLIGIRERVIALGGTLDISSATGQGTTLGVCIPQETVHATST